MPKKVVHGEVCHQRHSATKLPEGGRGGGGGVEGVAGHWALLAVMRARCKNWRMKMLCECFRSWRQTASELADGGFQGGAAGHRVLAVTTHCRSQALENVWVLQAPGAGESCVCCRTLLNGHPRTSKQTHFHLEMPL